MKNLKEKEKRNLKEKTDLVFVQHVKIPIGITNKGELIIPKLKLIILS